MKGSMNKRWVISAFPAEDMGQGSEDIFDYLLLIHIFSQFFCFWSECAPHFRSTWALRVLSLAVSLQEGWGFCFRKSAYLPLIHTIPAFKLVLCPLLSLPSTLVSFYLPTAKRSGVFRAHVAKHICSICQVRWSLLTSFHRGHWGHSSRGTWQKPAGQLGKLWSPPEPQQQPGPSSLPRCRHDSARKPAGLKVSLVDMIAGFCCTAQEILGCHCLFQP